MIQAVTGAAILPAWLATMRSITGVSAARDGDKIVMWSAEIAKAFSEFAAYSKEDSRATTPWCGQTIAYCMAVNGIRPVDGYLEAVKWTTFGTKADVPQQGDTVVLLWDAGSDAGGHHVTMLEQVQGNSYLCRGGNQSHQVKLSTFPARDVIAVRRPPGAATVSVMAAPIDVPKNYSTGITATVFGGFADMNISAYDKHVITDQELSCALPYRLDEPRPQLRIWRGGRGVLVDVADVGPWYDGRPGWLMDPWPRTGTRPRAESDPRTNGAGIDLSPAAAKLLGIDGKGKVDVEFVAAAPVSTVLLTATPGAPKVQMASSDTQMADFIIDLVNPKA